MTATLVAEDFLEVLKKSDLLTPQQLGELESLRGLEYAVDVAATLVQWKWLTRFQADRLLSGRYRGFFIGRYKVRELLGSGGMGCLYVAENAENGETVALKVLNDSAKNDTGLLARFELEARAGIRLNHPDIIRTYEVDLSGPVSYMVMEYVEGINLHELTVLQGAKPWRQACDFIRQAASGLHHAHENGLVHRDVKPSNLLVDRDGRVRILDFGLALLDGADGEDEFSLAMIFGHECLGTADYMSPEQATDSLGVDRRADIYSLGCTLFYAIAGGVPYPADSNSLKLEAHRDRPVPSIRERVPDVPAELDAVVRRMMSKRPADHFATAAEVVAALAPFATRQPVNFDFRSVLDIRTVDTRRRVRRDRSQKKSVDLASGSTMSGANLSHAGRKPQDRVETVVAADTRTRGSSISLVDPFDSSRGLLSSVAGREGGPRSASEYSPELLDELVRSSGLALVPTSGAGATVALSRAKIVIGRNADCDVVLPLPGVSGRHCELLFEGTCWRVRDLDSKNGIAVNSAAVKDQVLVPGDMLTVGKLHHFWLQSPSAAAPKPKTDVPLAVQLGVAAAALVIVALLLWLAFR